jgi:lipoyl-dependent peroxiredoxin
MNGSGDVVAESKAFAVPATFPSLTVEPANTTTPEELLAASHAVCYGIGLRGLIARRGGRADRVTVIATITAEKGPHGIRLLSSHLKAVVEGLAGLAEDHLQEIAKLVEEGCTISVALRGNVVITSEVVSS